MKVLVTGSSGFIGSFISTNLSGYEVVAPSSKELNLVDGEAVSDYFSINKFDVIIHCATVGRETPRSIDSKILSDNIAMFANLARCRNTFKKMINFSSGADFSVESSLENISESELEKYLPIQSYGLSKNITARMAKSLDCCYNLRLFSTIDKSESENRLMKRFLSSIKENKQFILKDDRYVDFFSLDDVSKVVDFYLNNEPKNRDMNLVYLKKHKVSDLLKMYCTIHDISHDTYFVENQSPINYLGDGKLLHEERIDLDGIMKTLENYI